jgi:peptide/nickel transport system substrate-binding protein
VPTPPLPRVLTVCLGQEPSSLFIYSDTSAAARSVRQAIYDGSSDLRGFQLQPVILESLPSLANEGARLEATQVVSNTLVAASDGLLANLAEGVSYLPAGCSQPECAQTYPGTGVVSLDQLVVRFRLRSGLLWSDGAPLTASDSVFSYQVAKSLYPRVRPDLLDYTQSYQALDELMVDWRGVPGAKDPLYQTNFFAPLPQHAWGNLAAQDLLSSDAANRTPLGWGPYVIDEWTAGDHISLSRNPNYFRFSEGLPRFERLVYRFVGEGEAALEALLAGECDFVDESGLGGLPRQRLLELQEEGKLKAVAEPGMDWEHLDFGIASVDPAKTNLFQSKAVRQAVAQCIDRQALADSLFLGKSVTLNTYVLPNHPLYNAEARGYAYDPQAAATALDAAGWIDVDGNPQTPRLSQAVPGIPDGTALSVNYQTLGGGERQQAAQFIRDELVQCGLQVNLQFGERETLFAPGPDGLVFGRRFDMAQFAWPSSLQPACSLYITSEIPGPYPQYPKGWGGANETGYSNPEFDQACQRARLSLPDFPDYAAAHLQAQAIFAEDLPVLPLYVHLTWVAMRSDLCGVDLQAPVESALWNLETWDYGDEGVCP